MQPRCRGPTLAFGSGLAALREQRDPDRSATMVSLRNLLSLLGMPLFPRLQRDLVAVERFPVKVVNAWFAAALAALTRLRRPGRLGRRVSAPCVLRFVHVA